MGTSGGLVLAHIQFTDFDQVGQALNNFPLHCLPQVGDNMHVIKTDMFYRLEVEEVLHILELHEPPVSDHQVTISCKVLSERIRCSK
jgi:hypothetical protein